MAAQTGALQLAARLAQDVQARGAERALDLARALAREAMQIYATMFEDSSEWGACTTI